MTNWTRFFIKIPCVPVDCRQLLKSPGYRTPGRLVEVTVGENVPRYGTKPLVVQALIQRLLDLTDEQSFFRRRRQNFVSGRSVRGHRHGRRITIRNSGTQHRPLDGAGRSIYAWGDRLPTSASAHFGQLRTVSATTRKLKAAVHWQLRTDGSHANRHGPALLIQDCVGAHPRRLAASNPSEEKINGISDRPRRALLSECILRVITA